MLSLQQALLEKLQQIPDLGDLKPSLRVQPVFSDFDLMNEKKSLFVKYKEILTYHRNQLPSSQQQQNAQQLTVLWAIHTFPKAVERDSNILSLFRYICHFFENEQSEQIIEYNAILCASEIAQKHGKQTISVLLPALLNRVSVFPAVEYANCFQNLIPSIETAEIKGKIIPKIVEFMKNGGDAYQHIGSTMFCMLPLANINLTQEILDSFLHSPIFIANYLHKITNALSDIFGSGYVSTVLIQKLLPISNSRENTREGAVNAVLKCINQKNIQSVYIFILTAFGWASNNDNLSLALLSHSDTVLTKKHTEFHTKLREFAIKIADSNNVQNRIKLASIIGNCSLIYQGSKGNLRCVLKSLAEDNDVDVRFAFLSAFPNLYKNIMNRDHDFLYQLFLQFFQDTSLIIQEFLMSAIHIYSQFFSQLKIITPLFLRLFRNSTTWRQKLSCIRTCISFPDDIIKIYGCQMVTIVDKALKKFPHPLADNAIMFYIRLIQCNMRDANEELMKLIIIRYSQSQQHAIRALFIKIASSLSFIINVDTFYNNVWPYVNEMQKDHVSSVRAVFLSNLPKFRMIFKQNGDLENVSLVDSVFENMKSDSDIYVQEVWHKFEDQFFLCNICNSNNNHHSYPKRAKTTITSSAKSPISRSKSPTIYSTYSSHNSNPFYITNTNSNSRSNNKNTCKNTNANIHTNTRANSNANSNINLNSNSDENINLNEKENHNSNVNTIVNSNMPTSIVRPLNKQCEGDSQMNAVFPCIVSQQNPTVSKSNEFGARKALTMASYTSQASTTTSGTAVMSSTSTMIDQSRTAPLEMMKKRSFGRKIEVSPKKPRRSSVVKSKSKIRLPIVYQIS